MLETLGIAYEKRVVSAHRTPVEMMRYAAKAEERGLKVIIAGAGGAAHLPGMVASETAIPVIGVPIQSRALQGLDSLLSIVQMPGGIPVATPKMLHYSREEFLHSKTQRCEKPSTIGSPDRPQKL
jgi:5-(carboxyamino)imidazole ribonucleotide mutase